MTPPGMHPQPMGYAAMPPGYGLMPNPYAMPAGYAGIAPPPVEPMESLVQPDSTGGKGTGCTTGCSSGCTAGCDTCGSCKGWCHCFNFFGEFLYLRARDAEVAYAVPIDGSIIVGPTSQQVQTGSVGVVDPDYQPGFRFGGGFTLDETSAVQLTYTQLDSNTTDDVSLPGGRPVLRSLVSSPNPLNIGADGLDAFADLNIQFKLFDVDYKGLIAYTEGYKVAYVVGARYAQLDQDFSAQFEVLGVETVDTRVNFEGGGLKLGLEGERYVRNGQLFVYGKGDVSFIGGEFRADYLFGTQGDPIITDTSFDASRLVTITNLEVGVGWQNKCGNLRLSSGYMYNVWYNVLRTNEFINAVQTNNFTDPSDNFYGMMSFDGFTAKVEVLW